ncbi:hypothetical protein VTO42DRAFT_7183 [Malbranchea cinnamomea]
MKVSTNLLLVGFAVASQSWALPLLQASSWSGWDGVEFLFVFGNSYTTTGFDPSLEQPNPSNPLGNPPYPGWTSSNGPNWIDFLATTYNQSYVRTYNLAYGGATVDSDLVPPYEPTVLSLKNQVEDQFLPIYGGKPESAPWAEDNTLFAIFIGINDVGNTYWTEYNSLYDQIFTVYDNLISQIYQSGGRNFLFLNVPPVDRSPLTIEQNEQAQVLENAAIQNFNSRIATLATKVQTLYGTRVFLLDTHAIFTAVLDNPASYAETAVYKNLTKYCDAYQNGTPDWYTFTPECGIPVNEYFWLNSLHPTFPVHNATAREVAALLGQP